MSQADEAIRQPALGPLGWARWTWRNLTSMRTALFLLLLLSVAAVPGSIFPQRTIDPGRVADYLADNPSTCLLYTSRAITQSAHAHSHSVGEARLGRS